MERGDERRQIVAGREGGALWVEGGVHVGMGDVHVVTRIDYGINETSNGDAGDLCGPHSLTFSPVKYRDNVGRIQALMRYRSLQDASLDSVDSLLRWWWWW